MAETPDCAYAIANVGAQAIAILTMLYKGVAEDAVAAYFDGGPPPFVTLSGDDIDKRLACIGRTQIFAHMKVLREKGVIEEYQGGWLLMPRPDVVPITRTDARQQRDAGSDGLDASQDRVRKPELGPVPRTTEVGRISYERPYISTVPRPELVRPPDSAPRTKIRPSTVSSIATNQFVKTNEINRPASQASQIFSEGTTNSRKRAVALIEELAIFEPSDPDRRFKVSDSSHIDLAEDLLRIDWLLEEENVDVFKHVDDRYTDVLAICRDFMTICETNWQNQERWWRPRMLSLKLRGTASESPWAATEGKVKAWRRERDERKANETAKTNPALAAEAEAVAAYIDELASHAKQDPALSDFAKGLRAANLQLTGVCAIEPTQDWPAKHRAALEAERSAIEAGRPPTLEEVKAAARAVPALENP